MIGEIGVGKTFLIRRFVKSEMDNETLPTLSVEYFIKNVTLSNNEEI